MKLRRSSSDKVIAGVCGGIGSLLETSSKNVRIAFVLLVLFGGISMITYLIAWALIPYDND